MNNKLINIKSFSILVLGAALLTGAGTLVAYSLNQPTMLPAAPEYAELRRATPIVDAPEVAQAWSTLLAAADAGDQQRLRQYVAVGGPDAESVAAAFCDLLIQSAAAHDAAARRFGQLPAEHAAFFAHGNAAAYTTAPDSPDATVCAVLPVCGADYEPMPVTMRRLDGRWQVAAVSSLRGTVVNEPASATIGRLNRSAEVLRLAAADIKAGAYGSVEDAVLAIQQGLWRAGLQGK